MKKENQCMPAFVIIYAFVFGSLSALFSISEFGLIGTCMFLFMFMILECIFSRIEGSRWLGILFHFVAAITTFVIVALGWAGSSDYPVELWQSVSWMAEPHPDRTYTVTDAAIWWYVLAALPVLRLLLQPLLEWCRK